MNAIANDPEGSADGKKRHPRVRILLSLLLVLGLGSGCAVGPDFHRPEAAVPARWSQYAQPAPPLPQKVADEKLAHWWSCFHDPMLSSLEKRAVAANLDLKLAEARVREARAQRAVAAGGLGPSLDASGAYSRGRPKGGPTGDQYQAGFDAGWEIDIFGGQRRNLEAAGADLQAAVESRRDVLVSLLAEVAVDYIQLRTYQQQLAITRDNLAAQQHSARLVRERFEGGFVSALDVANAEAQTATTASRIPLLESAAQQTLYSLSILMGEPPAALETELSPPGAIPGAIPEVPVGVPSDLLRRRPDIRAAEARLHAATARIGVAVADLFPSFTLSGALGYQTVNLGSLFTGGNQFWSFGPSVSLPLFESGRLRANVEVQRAIAEQDLITYRQTVLDALQEVENALVASVKEAAHRKSLVEAVAANRRAVGLAEKLYTEGLTDFINVLQAEQARYSSEDALVQSTATLATNLVALYKALGGGWLPDSDKGAAARKVAGAKAQSVATDDSR